MASYYTPTGLLTGRAPQFDMRGINQSIGQISGELNAMKNRDLTAQELAYNRKRQAIADGRATTLFDQGQADRVKGLAQDQALSELLTNGNQFKTVDRQVTTREGNAGNASEIAAIKARNASLAGQKAQLDTDTSAAAAKYEIDFEKYNTRPEVKFKDLKTANSGKNVIEVNDKGLTPGRSRTTHLEYADGSEVSWWDKLTGDYNKIKTFTPAVDSPNIHGQGTNFVPETETSKLKRAEFANKSATKSSGLDVITARWNALKEKETLPKEEAAVAKIVKTVSGKEKMTKLEQRDDFIERIKSNKILSGSNKIAAIKNAESMFPVEKEMSVSEQIALHRVNLMDSKQKAEIIKEARSLNDIKKIYPNMPAGIRTLDGAKTYANKENKAKKTETFNLKKEMYSLIDGKDLGEVAAVDKILKKSEGKLKSMTLQDQKAWVEKLKALYQGESSIDPSDYFGGDPITDAYERMNNN